MWGYSLMFFLAAVLVIYHIRPRLPDVGGASAYWNKEWWAALFFLTLIIGLRHEVGADWISYENHIYYAYGEEFGRVIERGDPSYAALNWFGANVFGGVYFVNSVCAALFSFGLLTFCRSQPRPWLALLIALPYLVVVVAMGYTRQGVAIGLAMIGLTVLLRGSVIRFIFWIAVAATFHKSAVIMIPLATFYSQKNKFITFFGVLSAGAALFLLLVMESIDSLSYTYIEREYQSSGAAIRVAMNLVPASIYLLFRNKFRITDSELSFWNWVSLGGLAFVPLLALSPSSTAVDRIALYWIPLQIFVYSRLPDVLGQHGKRNHFG